jgi:eukaryotic-like serine/threonine-protein kinase
MSAPGTPRTIAHYELLAKIGAGGMGEVYRARDSKLGRDVAIKVLPPGLAHESDYLSRLQREAHLLASINHPNIGGIYGLEDGAIVMELVEGSTLADRLQHGPIPLDEALTIAKQIADAFEAAHEKGIIHRDLKPANVKVTPDGVVKVLDFGLAKAVDTADPQNAASSPTMTIRATQAGFILGTAAYMSPEQAAGKTVDRRSDIWSFGVVLWEMLTGKRMFDGETISHTLADVLRAPIDFDAVESTPAPILELLRRCLDRDVKTRLQWIGEARIAIQQYLTNPSAPVPSTSRPAIWIGRCHRPLRRSACRSRMVSRCSDCRAAGDEVYTRSRCGFESARRDVRTVRVCRPCGGDFARRTPYRLHCFNCQ